MQTNFCRIDSPLGKLLLVSNGQTLMQLHTDGNRTVPADWVEQEDAVLKQTREQLSAYFAGERTTFDVPLGAEGTAFQREVWRELRQIPFGETISYGEMARRIGRPRAARAVGDANRRNPIGIIVPCHRVIGVTGELVGYAGGLSVKRWLLDHEARRSGR